MKFQISGWSENRNRMVRSRLMCGLSFLVQVYIYIEISFHYFVLTIPDSILFGNYSQKCAKCHHKKSLNHIPRKSMRMCRSTKFRISLDHITYNTRHANHQHSSQYAYTIETDFLYTCAKFVRIYSVLYKPTGRKPQFEASEGCALH